MSKLPRTRTRMPGVDRFDIELNAFLRSCGFVVFYYEHPSRLWVFRDDAAAPEEMSRAFNVSLRLALVDPDTGTEPTREKLDDGLAALGFRNLYGDNLKQRLATYEAACQAAYEACQPSGMPEDI